MNGKNLFVGILSAMLFLSMGAFAYNFNLHKTAKITGDWVWDGSHWTQPNPHPITAIFANSIKSNGLQNMYSENENIGTPWKYKLKSSFQTDDSGKTAKEFKAITVNDPADTPATEYTQFNFREDNYGEYTSSHLSVSGEGYVAISQSVSYDSEFRELTNVGVNE